jgi:hypothetical protein
LLVRSRGWKFAEYHSQQERPSPAMNLLGKLQK